MKQKAAIENSPAAAWHCEQAAGFFGDSFSRIKSTNARAIARKRFASNAKAALATMGLEPFLKLFDQWLQAKGHGEHAAAAEAVIRELAIGPTAQPAASVERLATIGKLIEAAVRLAMGEGK